MNAHSLLGASSAYRWLACPGSFHLSQTAPHRPSSIYAATGSLAHDLIEEAVRAGTTEIHGPATGAVRSRDGHAVTIDQDMITGVNVMLAYLEQIVALSDWSDVEFRVSLDGYFRAPPVPLFGTVDAAALSLWDETLEVVDYKNGAGVVVNPVENPQLLYYAAGVLHRLSAHERALVRRIRLTIVQPHAGGVAPIRSWEIIPLDLLMWIDDVLVPGVKACTQPDAPFNPGSWCRFCPVSHACPRLHEDALAVAKREFEHEFDDAELPTEPNSLADHLDIAERAQLWIDRVREHAVDQLQHQVRIPGWGLVPTRPTRKWCEHESSIAIQLRNLGLDADVIFETQLRSPAQVEKQLLRTSKGRLIWDQAAVMVEAKSTGVKLGRTGTNAREDFIDE